MNRFYLKKYGKYLAYKQYEEDVDYLDEYTTEIIQGGWYWTSDIEKAKCFYDKHDIRCFLVRMKGEFWEGITIDNK